MEPTFPKPAFLRASWKRCRLSYCRTLAPREPEPHLAARMTTTLVATTATKTKTSVRQTSNQPLGGEKSPSLHIPGQNTTRSTTLRSFSPRAERSSTALLWSPRNLYLPSPSVPVSASDIRSMAKERFTSAKVKEKTSRLRYNSHDSG